MWQDLAWTLSVVSAHTSAYTHMLPTYQLEQQTFSSHVFLHPVCRRVAAQHCSWLLVYTIAQSSVVILHLQMALPLLKQHVDRVACAGHITAMEYVQQVLEAL